MASPKLFGFFIMHLLVLFVSNPCVVLSLNASTLCIKEERVALLKFKKDLKEAENSLSSWVGKDCCNWTGIECHNQSGHILKLDLLQANASWVRDVSWLSTLSSLQYLRMDFVKVTSTADELFLVVIRMPSLLELYLMSCNLDTLPPSLPFESITSPLSVLDLSGNPFKRSSIPSWLFNMSNLTHISLSLSSLRGPLPLLRRGNLCKLQNLDLSYNDLTGGVTQMLDTLSFCSNQSLEYLDLSSNHLTGKLPASIGNLSKLSFLYLQGNMMNGEIPKSIGQLTQLNTLNLFQNNWVGTMTNIHFHNLTNLFSFSVSSKTNSFAFKATQDWIPPFKQLYYLKIHGCQVGPTFPNWLRNQTDLEYVILENAGISGEIPRWLYNMFSHIWELDLSHNKISGYLPKTLNFSIPVWCTVTALDLRNNLLSGTVTANIGEEMSNMEYLDLSNNNLNGSIPQSINRMQLLLYLDLSNNYLTGPVPVFPMSIQHLSIIDLSNNSLSGGIPTSLCSLPSIFILELSNNNLSANLSTVFQNCTSLGSLSLGNNKFFGSVPKKINKNFPILEELLLRGNTLTGSIPEELCGLPSLHLLDLAENNLSGSIPTCLGDVHGFKMPQTYFINSTEPVSHYISLSYTRHMELILKGRTVQYKDRMPVHSTIDLSNNELCGKIPDKLTELIHLGVLNLSWNRLTGNIPNNIGSLTNLESLDLSNNCLSGPIPPSMGTMTFLSYLNLSYNNFFGQIPVANQFGTFNDPSIYVGNPQLCGIPLPTNCSSSSPGNANQGRKHEDNEDDDKTERLCLYGSIALGYITGFWLVCGSLMLKRSWRHAYFKFVFDIIDKVCVLIAVNLAYAKRRFGLERN